MHTQNSTSLSNLKKTLLGVMVLSAVTAGLVLFEEYRANQEAAAFSTYLSHYNVPAHVEEQGTQRVIFFKRATDNSLLTTDANELAAIAEQNLVAGMQVTEPQRAPEQAKPTLNNQLEKPLLTQVNTSMKASSMVIEPTSKEMLQPQSTEILFALSSAAITPEYKLALFDMAQQINQQPAHKKWQVIGHTDKSGRALFNLKLAQKRAQSVINFLLEHGVKQQQLVLITLGEYEAMQLTASAYNQGARKVQVMPYAAEIDKLALQVKRQTQHIEQRLQAKRTATLQQVNDALQAKSVAKSVDKSAEITASLFAEPVNQEAMRKTRSTINNEVVEINSALVLNDLVVSPNAPSNKHQHMLTESKPLQQVNHDTWQNSHHQSEKTLLNKIIIPSQSDTKNVTNEQQNRPITVKEQALISMLNYQL